MRFKERRDYLINAPRIAFDIAFRGKYNFKYDLMPVSTSRMSLSKRINLIKAGLNLFHLRLKPWSWPIHMHIELTSYCNLSCAVCPTGTKELKRKPLAMDPALFKKLFDEVSPYLLTTSLWGWGEPLLHPQLSEILKIASNRGVSTLLSTNGQNLNDEKVLQALIDYPPNYLIVALDGITDETNTVYRKGAKIDPALEGVKWLAEMKEKRKQQFPVLHLRYIAMKHNEHELPLLPDFARNNGFEFLSIRTLSIIDAPDDVHSVMVPENEKYRAYNYENERRIRRKDYICEQCFIFPAVFADGTVVACDQDYNGNQYYGTIAGDVPFSSLWWNSKSQNIRRVIRDMPDNFSFCHNCPFRDRPVSTCSIQSFDFRK